MIFPFKTGVFSGAMFNLPGFKSTIKKKAHRYPSQSLHVQVTLMVRVQVALMLSVQVVQVALASPHHQGSYTSWITAKLDFCSHPVPPDMHMIWKICIRCLEKWKTLNVSLEWWILRGNSVEKNLINTNKNRWHTLSIKWCNRLFGHYLNLHFTCEVMRDLVGEINNTVQNRQGYSPQRSFAYSHLFLKH